MEDGIGFVGVLFVVLPRSSRFFGRWTMRIVGALLVCLQPIPVVGAFSLPAMCLLNFMLYRRLLRRQGQEFAGQQVMVQA